MVMQSFGSPSNTPTLYDREGVTASGIQYKILESEVYQCSDPEISLPKIDLLIEAAGRTMMCNLLLAANPEDSLEEMLEPIRYLQEENLIGRSEVKVADSDAYAGQVLDVSHPVVLSAYDLNSKKVTYDPARECEGECQLVASILLDQYDIDAQGLWQEQVEFTEDMVGMIQGALEELVRYGSAMMVPAPPPSKPN